jgi:hypothetical protein
MVLKKCNTCSGEHSEDVDCPVCNIKTYSENDVIKIKEEFYKLGVASATVEKSGEDGNMCYREVNYLCLASCAGNGSDCDYHEHKGKYPFGCKHRDGMTCNSTNAINNL